TYVAERWMAPRSHQRQPSAVSALRKGRNRYGRGKTWHRYPGGYTQQHSQKRRPEEVRKGRVMEYLVVVEKGGSSYGAYVPDLPGCVAAAETPREALKLIRDAVKLHIEALRESGQSVPEPTSKSDVVKVRAAL